MGKKELKHKEEQNDDYKEKWQRALADYQNLQKEVLARREEWSRLSEQQILEEFIPVYDHLKMALLGEKSDANANAWVEGVKYVVKQFGDILKSHGVEEIKTTEAIFDPKFHEAVGQEEMDDVAEDSIIREISCGYVMGERVIRPAKVIVARQKSE